jgi:predicted DNA-binding transcriptional regulator AlpA
MQTEKPKKKKTRVPAGPVMRRPEAMSFVGLRDTMFDQAVREGELPPPIKVTDTGRAVVWLRSELEAWLAARIAKRDKERKQREVA